MIIYTSGNLLESSADGLVNTVNCEGYMGKGIAYQFKMQFPNNNIEYVKACNQGNIGIGKVFYYKEKGKVIINFPTKNKWRRKSKIEYISEGLDDLVKVILKLNLKSVAIPPLGSGNGGLNWSEVKPLIEDKLNSVSKDVDIYIYEPYKQYKSAPTVEPRLSASALILMDIKKRLIKFDTLRLQKAAYFMDVFSKEKYFNHTRHKYGPYDNSIYIISRNIKEFQTFHGVKNTNEARAILYNKLVSQQTDTTINRLAPFLEKSCDLVNAIETDRELECLSTVTFLIEEQSIASEKNIVDTFLKWSEDKATRFSETDILNSMRKLSDLGVIEKSIGGYSLSQ